MLNLYINETAKNFTPNGTVGGGITLKGGVGLGASGVIGISGGIEGNIGVDWSIYANAQDYININGSIGAYAKAFAGPVTLFEKSFPFAKGTIWDHPSTKVNNLYLAEQPDFYDTTSYSLIDRSYAQSNSDFIANDDERLFYAYAPQNKIEKTLKTNVYTHSEPQLAEFSDGTLLAVWLDDDLTRTDINRTTLLYSYYDGSKWSSPAQINNDKTGDYSPSLEVIEDTAYISWINSKKVLNNDAAIDEIFKTWEVAAASFNKTTKAFENVSVITSDSHIDMSPEIFGDKSGVKLVWVSNSSDDIFSENNTYSVVTSILSGNTWGSPVTYANNLMPIDSIDGCVYNGKTYIAYAVDIDGNQADYSDKEVYLNKNRLTENNTLDSKPVFKNGKLYFYSNGAIVEHNLSDNTEKVIVNTITTDRFDVVSDGENCAIVYLQADSLANELYAVIYDSYSDKWGESIPLTQLASSIGSYSGVLSDDGKMKFLINKTEISGDINSANPYGQTDISLFTVTPSYDLSIDNVSYHEELLVQGNTLEFYTQITNRGELTVNNYAVKVLDTNGKVLATTYNEEPILPGVTVDFTAYYPLGDEKFNSHNVSVNIVPLRASDSDETDNSYDVMLDYEDISLENISYGIGSDGDAVIHADIVNRGNSISDNITVTLRKDSADGTIAETIVINEKLDTLDFTTVSFSVPYVEDSVYYMTIEQAGGDSDFVVIKQLETEIIVFDEENNKVNVNSFEEIGNAELIVGAYRRGRMLDINSKKVNIKEGENVVDSPATNFNNADAVKVMIWESLTNLKPVYEPIEKEL